MRYLLVMLLTLVFITIGCGDPDPTPHVNAVDCTADGDECKNNNNDRTICLDGTCVKPKQIEDCTEGGNECAANSVKTECKNLKCVEPIAQVEECTEGGNECASNTVKTECKDLKCVKPANATVCTESGNECATNTNGKTECKDLVCVEPHVNATDCTEGGGECIENTDNKTECDTETLKCVHLDKINCSENGNECADNENGKTKCSTEFICVDPNCTPVAETCDGKDNDCDGLIDNGDLCTTGFTNGKGACNSKEDGTAECILDSCNEGFYNNDDNATDCEYECTPLEGGEICNGLDDDCNGIVDDGFDLTTDNENCGACGTVCVIPENSHAGMSCIESVCTMGDCAEGWYDKNNSSTDGCEYECNYTGEIDNDCDGQDDNCDGTPDETADLTTVENCGACGNDCNAQVNEDDKFTVRISCDGTCKFTCRNNFYDFNNDMSDGCEEYCVKTNGGVEICDGLDNNCDNVIDDGLTCNCNDGQNQSCSVANTSCTGNQLCESGAWATCSTGNANNHAETCDGFDNDCDGSVDEDFMTGTKYTHNDHCGACNQACQKVHGNNKCLVSATCSPSCYTGFSDFNGNKFDGCETGCGTHDFNPALLNIDHYEIVAGGTSNENLKDADSVYRDEKLAIVYSKSSEIYVKVVDKNGNLLRDNANNLLEKKLTDMPAGKKANTPIITKYGDKYYVAYRSDIGGKNDIYFRAYDENFNTIGSTINISNTSTGAYWPAFSKRNNMRDRVSLVWYELDALNNRKIHHVALSTITNNIIGSEHKFAASDADNYYYPKVVTSKNYIGMLYCRQNDITHKSKLYFKGFNSDYSRYDNEELASYSTRYCDGHDYSISASTYYFYISYIDASGKAHVEKRSRTGYLYKQYTLNNSNSYTSIDYNNSNVVLSYVNASTYDLYTARFDSDLKLKNTNKHREFTSDKFRYYPSIFYTKEKEVLVQYSTSASTYIDIEISRTNTCEH